MQMTAPPPVDILILGAGWTAEFLIPLLSSSEISYAATTRDGRIVAGYQTLRFTISPDPESEPDWTQVPKARTIVLVFPTTEPGAVTRYVHGYETVHGNGGRWLQLGSTSAWNEAAESEKSLGQQTSFITRHAPIPRPASARVESEFELLSLSSSTRQTSVLNLSGLWGNARSARNWVRRIAATKDDLSKKGAVHLVHGVDVARAILAMHLREEWENGKEERWLLTDMRVYDWWDLASAWGSGGKDSNADPDDASARGDQARWVVELMKETDVAALPRTHLDLPGKHLSSTEFWDHFGLTPLRARLDEY